MMTGAAPQFRHEWVQHYQRNTRDYAQLLTAGPFSSWKEAREPQKLARFELEHALQILFSHQNSELANKFLLNAVAVAERIERENAFQSELVKPFFIPLFSAELARVRAHAESLLGRGLQTERLLQASLAYEEFAAGPQADAITQYFYLLAVDLALLAGDVARAESLLSARRSSRRDALHFATLKLLVPAIREGTPIADPAVLAKFDEYFNRVRAYPTPAKKEFFFEYFLSAFEMALMRERYFLSRDGAINWGRVIDLASA
jgi:hypothetical protein